MRTALAIIVTAIALAACATGPDLRKAQTIAETTYQITANGTVVICTGVQSPKVQEICAKVRSADATYAWPTLETSLLVAKATTIREGDPNDATLDAQHVISGVAHTTLQATGQ